MKAIYERHEILELPCKEIEKKWYMAKPLNRVSLWNRIKAAYYIMTQKAIAVKWH